MGSATGSMYFLKLCLGKQFLLAIKLVRAFLDYQDPVDASGSRQVAEALAGLIGVVVQ